MVGIIASVTYVAARGQPVDFKPGSLSSGGANGFALALGGLNQEADPVHSI